MIDFHPHSEPCYRCEATTWECIGHQTDFEKGRAVEQDIVECCFCGARMRVKAVAVATQRSAAGEEFRFQFGRFKGKTFAETDAEPNGRRYLEVLQGKNEKLRDRITKYLQNAAPSA